MSDPQAELVAVAEAIKEELNAQPQTFTLPFDAVRSYDTETELEDLDTLHVDVVPVKAPISLETQGSVEYRSAVDIGVRKKFGQADRDASGAIDIAKIDQLILLVQQIAEALIEMRLTAHPDAAWQSTEVRVWYVPRHLRELGQFTGIVRVEFATQRELVAG
jgi:hypothetical protein